MTLTRIKAAFSVLKKLAGESRIQGLPHSPSVESPDGNQEILLQQIKDLKSLLAQRDSEINILVNMVKKGKQIEVVEGADPKIVVQEIRNDVESKPLPNKVQTHNVRKENKSEKKEILIKKHLFGVPPPTDEKIFEDAAG
jgi:nucleosome binding factor SPN SPT16 subunit